MTSEYPPAGEQPPAGQQPPAGWSPPAQEPAFAHPPAAAAGRGFNAAQIPVPGWLLFGGFLIAIIASFLPFFTISVDGLGISASAGMSGAFKVVVFLLVAAGVGLLLPMMSRTPLESRRLIGITVVLGLMIGLFILVIVVNSKPDGLEGISGVSMSPAFGLILFGLAILAMAAGVVMLWMQRNKAPGGFA